MRIGASISTVVVAIVVAACATPGSGPSGKRIDEVPMYGGMDRSQFPDLLAADKKFIADVTAHYGSREKASVVWVEQGFVFYRQNNNAMAMRRFNQAWLLNPSNPEAYTGFASVLFDEEKYCDAVSMIDKGFSVGRIQDGFLTDAALILVGCAMQVPPPERKVTLLTRSDELFRQALASQAVSKDYTLTNWARAMYARNDYPAAWAKVAELRRTTGKDMPPEFLRELSAKMAEPK
jgi:tetratricopeptide (TPR) repeat protein